MTRERKIVLVIEEGYAIGEVSERVYDAFRAALASPSAPTEGLGIRPHPDGQPRQHPASKMEPDGCWTCGRCNVSNAPWHGVCRRACGTERPAAPSAPEAPRAGPCAKCGRLATEHLASQIMAGRDHVYERSVGVCDGCGAVQWAPAPPSEAAPACPKCSSPGLPGANGRWICSGLTCKKSWPGRAPAKEGT